jgi:hypothetical protein
MFVRTAMRRNKDDSAVRYLQLVHNGRDPATKAAKMKVFHKLRPRGPDRQGRDRAAGSLIGLLDPGRAAALREPCLSYHRSVAFGGPWLLDQPWQWLGIIAVLAAQLARTRRDASAERVLFAQVANRAGSLVQAGGSAWVGCRAWSQLEHHEIILWSKNRVEVAFVYCASTSGPDRESAPEPPSFRAERDYSIGQDYAVRVVLFRGTADLLLDIEMTSERRDGAWPDWASLDVSPNSRLELPGPVARYDQHRLLCKLAFDHHRLTYRHPLLDGCTDQIGLELGNVFDSLDLRRACREIDAFLVSEAHRQTRFGVPYPFPSRDACVSSYFNIRVAAARIVPRTARGRELGLKGKRNTVIADRTLVLQLAILYQATLSQRYWVPRPPVC